MKENKFATAMIRNAVEKGIREIQENPGRGIRKLVDLGNMFASGRFQKEFFVRARQELSNEESAYYKLVERVVCGTDKELLSTFGMGLGYGCWTYGAEAIREKEREEGYNIPWTIIHHIDPQREECLGRFKSTVEQGMDLGIYAHMVFVDTPEEAAVGELLDVFSACDSCVYCLFVSPGAVTRSLAQRLLEMKSVLVAVAVDKEPEEALSRAAGILHESRCLYSGYTAANNPDTPLLLEQLKQADRLEIPFLIFVEQSPLESGEASPWGHPLDQLREQLEIPVFPIDFFRDIAMVDRNISSEGCIAMVDPQGELALVDMERQKVESGWDLGAQPLVEALKKNLPKAPQ